MASCLPQCERRKFTIQEIGRLADRMQNVLENKDSRKIFKDYLPQVQRQDLLKVLRLWEDVNISLKLGEAFDEEAIMEQIDEIDDFNVNPLLSISENDKKMHYVKQESARILNRIHTRFIYFLHQYHEK